MLPSPKQKRLKRRLENQALAGVKKQKLPSRKWLVRELDAELSRQVRNEKTMCAFCPLPAECCFHYLTRSHYATRWDRQNVTASCFGCNSKMENDAAFVHYAVDRFIQTHGREAWDALVLKHHQVTHFSRTDLAAMLEVLQQEGRNAPPF